MKFEKHAKYNTYAVLALIVVAFAAVLVSLAMHVDAIKAIFSKMMSVFSPVLYAVIIMLILLPMVNFFEDRFCKLLKKHKNYEKKAEALALVCAYLILLLVLVLAVVIVIPQFTTLYEFVLGSTEYLSALDSMANEFAAGSDLFGDRLLELFDSLKQAVKESLKQLPTLVTKIASAFGNVISQVSNWVLGLIISIYAMLRRDYLKALARKINAAIFKPQIEARIADVCREMYNNTLWFFSARAYNCIAIAVVFYAVLLLMGCKFYSVLCLVIALCSFVPIFGMLVGGTIGTLIVLVTDTRLVGWFVFVFFVLMILDYAFLRPRVTNKKVRVSLGTTMICVLIGYFVWDFLGALFAVPLYITARDLFFTWRKKKMTAYNGE